MDLNLQSAKSEALEGTDLFTVLHCICVTCRSKLSVGFLRFSIFILYSVFSINIGTAGLVHSIG